MALLLILVSFPAIVFDAAASEATLRRNGEQVFHDVCVACHSTGLEGAPRIDSPEEWRPRLAKGEATLVQHALRGFQGKGFMPPRGGCNDCLDEEIVAGVRYMLDQVSK